MAADAAWQLGPFVVLTLGQRCYTCSDTIAPGATGYRCADGEVRCADHRGAGG